MLGCIWKGMKHNLRGGGHDQALDKCPDLFLDPTDRNLAQLTVRVLYRDAYGRWTKLSCVLVWLALFGV